MSTKGKKNGDRVTWYVNLAKAPQLVRTPEVRAVGDRCQVRLPPADIRVWLRG